MWSKRPVRSCHSGTHPLTVSSDTRTYTDKHGNISKGSADRHMSPSRYNLDRTARKPGNLTDGLPWASRGTIVHHGEVAQNGMRFTAFGLCKKPKSPDYISSRGSLSSDVLL